MHFFIFFLEKNYFPREKKHFSVRGGKNVESFHTKKYTI